MLVVSLFVFLLMTSVASAQGIGADQCQACVNYIANGSVMDWIALALFLIPMVVFAFTKNTLQGTLRTILEKSSDLGRSLSKKSDNK